MAVAAEGKKATVWKLVLWEEMFGWKAIWKLNPERERVY
jgi:hypothetical protein